MIGFSKTTPDKKLNFFQNYSHHLNHLNKQFNGFCNELRQSPNTEQSASLISNKALSGLNIFEPLHDGHDYADEILGASVLPMLGLAVTGILVIKSLWKLSVSAAMHFNVIKKNEEPHYDNGMTLLTAAALTITITAYTFLKSIMSLVTRPISTMIRGWDKQTPDRFLSDKDAENINNSAIAELTSLVF